MDINNLYIAEVKNKNDPDQQGKVQVFIADIHESADLTGLPWAIPFDGGRDFIIPEVGDFLWVFFEKPDIYQNPFYMTPVKNNSLNSLSTYTSIQNTLGNNTGPTTSYPDLKYMSAPNGCIMGISTSSTTPEIFISHPHGASFFIDQNGQLFIEAKNVVVKTTDQTKSAIAVNDATSEVACVNENYVVTSMGLQPILPSNVPTRAITKIKN